MPCQAYVRQILRLVTQLFDANEVFYTSIETRFFIVLLALERSCALSRHNKSSRHSRYPSVLLKVSSPYHRGIVIEIRDIRKLGIGEEMQPLS